ncbi:MAG: putative toxin-antitoxin system toxin component, PIN family [Rhodocyclales bacterium]|nr:putative toxin-antitoxin system toxin component, PIN family [Rhodocyclales bacterium]
MTLRLVLDTNVVLDLLHFRDACAAPIMAALRAGTALCFTNAACCAELAEVLGRRHFGLAQPQAQRILADYAALARPCEAVAGVELPPLPICADADDQKFLELARAAAADLLITKDKALLHLACKKHRLSGFRIIRPEDWPARGAWQS